jgi:diaminohydroxyphosphoribosylaminopyrimidine deaminase/5-amino-6-(5-phosphoribosylamino)uracil reductase
MSEVKNDDEFYIKRCIELAEKALGKLTRIL